MFLERVLQSSLVGEKVVFYLRRHWLTFVTTVLRYIFFLALPFVVGYVILKFFPELWDRVFNGGLTDVIAQLLISLYFLSVWFFFWDAWVNYYLDVWLVTNERIVALEQHGLFNRTVAEIRLEKVQDVSTKVTGWAGTFFGYGDAYVQSAGSETFFALRKVPHPYKVTEKILRLVDDWKQTHPQITKVVN